MCILRTDSAISTSHLFYIGSDVQIVVEKNTFKLHRAIICSRCKWLQVLLADRWRTQASPDDKKVEITSFSADVFGTVVEFLYTGCAIEIALLLESLVTFIFSWFVLISY